MPLGLRLIGRIVSASVLRHRDSREGDGARLVTAPGGRRGSARLG